MKKLLTIFSFLILFGFGQFLAAQEAGYKYCGTTEVLEKAFRDNPQMRTDYESRRAKQMLQDAAEFQKGYPKVKSMKASAPTYVIPIVFHIIHNYGSENISDAQILDEMRILNQDYQKRNADTSAVDSVFKNNIANVGIEFRLAKLDPNGNCTNGIDRIASLQTYIGDDGSKLNDWPRSKYLNVWVVNSMSSGAAGYAYLPGTCPSSVDGIIILSQYIGSIGSGTVTTSKALTHEIGHFFDLEHPWGNTNQPGVACGDDAVSDTPITKGWNHCPAPSGAFICNAAVEENYQNYMDYSYCSHMFTNGQANRMIAALTSTTASRNNLSSAANLLATGVNNTPVVCAPKADFTPSSTVLVCAGGSAQFNYFLSGGRPSSWSWTFAGGTPATSTDSFPLIQYQTPGTYSVTMSVSNSAGTNTVTKNAYVIVTAATAQYTATSFVEGFENNTTVASDWIMVSPQGNPWKRSTAAATSGTACLSQNNLTNSIGEVLSAISPSFDMTAIPSAAMTFKYAFAQTATTNTDRLRIYFSTNCGNTWQVRYTASGIGLTTGGVVTSNFIPSATQWKTGIVGVAPFQTDKNLRMKFEITNGGGNNIYIDDINIASSFSGILEEAAGISDLFVFPNPAQEHAIVSFSLKENEPVSIGVFDVTGRKVQAVLEENLSAGEHKFDIPFGGKLKAGMYFITLIVNNHVLSQKLIVN